MTSCTLPDPDQFSVGKNFNPNAKFQRQHSPMSEISTAPPTPFVGLSLDEPVHASCFVFGFSLAEEREKEGDTSQEKAPPTPFSSLALDEPVHAFLPEFHFNLAEEGEEEQEGSWNQRKAEWPPVMPVHLEEVPRLCIAMPPLHSELGNWAQRAVRWEDHNGVDCVGAGDEFDDAGHVAEEEEEEEEAEGKSNANVEWPPVMPQCPEEAPRLCVAMPHLKSELGKWAQWAVRWEEQNGLDCHHTYDAFDDAAHKAEEEEEEEGEEEGSRSDAKVDWPPIMPQCPEEAPRLCISIPPLQSELGRWAQWAVRWEEQNGLDCDERKGALDDDADHKVQDEEEQGGQGDVHVERPPLAPRCLEEAPGLCVATSRLQSELGTWAQQAVRWEKKNRADRDDADDELDDVTTAAEEEEEDEGEDGSGDQHETELYKGTDSCMLRGAGDVSDGNDSEPSEIVEWPPVLPQQAEETPRLCIAMPPLQSELGKWAQWAARWEDQSGLDCHHVDDELDDASHEGRKGEEEEEEEEGGVEEDDAEEEKVERNGADCHGTDDELDDADHEVEEEEEEKGEEAKAEWP
eukprot:CAMPEP_0117494100 /NCGR_PEP_ID=MMETSP0784-20121206/19438_1 /TAXON_ID=39447 /ORGANISM="" /LENGTH=573 /DNA_ID=CAMNT_0005288971 /DNA_START=25 /DNA_END=1743 /DNA_ORIENTATION=-